MRRCNLSRKARRSSQLDPGKARKFLLYLRPSILVDESLQLLMITQISKSALVNPLNLAYQLRPPVPWRHHMPVILIPTPSRPLDGLQLYQRPYEMPVHPHAIETRWRMMSHASIQHGKTTIVRPQPRRNVREPIIPFPIRSPTTRCPAKLSATTWHAQPIHAPQRHCAKIDTSRDV